MTKSRILVALLVGCIAGVAATGALAQTVEDRTQDKVAFPAHRMIGNIYYVGTGTLCSYLITTPEGHILINTNFEDTVPLMRAAIEQLGFKLTDIKIVLGSHAHGDHQQADAMFKELTGGAQFVAMEQDVPALQRMTPGDKPHPIDRIIKDGDTVTLGGTTLKAHLTPGHTRGCTTWTMKVMDGAVARDVVIMCGGVQDGARFVNNPNNPTMYDDFMRSNEIYRKLPVEVFLASHSWFFDLAGKHAKLAQNPNVTPNPYIDPAGYRAYVESMDKTLKAMLAEQKAKAGQQ
jgi:metallo-beta-lactamase class B